jgi:hypothetical protein
MNHNNISESFDKLIRQFSFLYRGRIVERRDGGFMAGRKWYSSLEELDKAIESDYEILSRSIGRIKTEK